MLNRRGWAHVSQDSELLDARYDRALQLKIRKLTSRFAKILPIMVAEPSVSKLTTALAATTSSTENIGVALSSLQHGLEGDREHPRPGCYEFRASQASA